MTGIFVAMIAAGCLFVLFGLSQRGVRGGCAGCSCGYGECLRERDAAADGGASEMGEEE